MGPFVGLGLSAGTQILGGLLKGKSEKKAAAAMNPWNVQGMFGQAQFDPNTRQATFNADRFTQGARNMLGENVQNMFGGGGYSPFLNFAQGLGNDQLPGLFQGYQQMLGQNMDPAFQQYQQQMGQAQGIANQDLQGMMDQRLGLLRQQAAPHEQQQYNSLQNRLFGQGRLGSTGGQGEVTAFARGLGEADLGRQLASQQLGIQAQNQNLAQAGLLSELAGTGFANALNYNDIGVNRAAQRMQNAMGLFGFGNDLNANLQQQGLAGLQGMMGIDTNAMNAMALGKNLSGSAQQAQMMSGSPLGSALTGLGTGLMQNMDFTKLFGGKVGSAGGGFNPTPSLGGNWWEGPQ